MSECSRFNYGEIVTICRWSKAVKDYFKGHKYIVSEHPVGRVENVIPCTDWGTESRTYQYRIIISTGLPIYVRQNDLFKVDPEYRNRKDMFDKFIQLHSSVPYFSFDVFKQHVDHEDQCIKYDRERPEFLPEYRNIPTGLEQSLNKLHDNMIDSLLYSVPTFYMAKEEMNAMFGVPKFECKKIIFNGPCTIILWKDGTKTIAKVSDGEMFDPEKGVAVCFMKRALGETEGKKVLRKANKDYYDEIARAVSKEFDEELRKATFPLPKGVTFRPWSDLSIFNNKVIKVKEEEQDDNNKV